MSFGFIDQVEVDFITNGRPEGATADRLSQVGYDAGLLRPMIMEDGKKYCWVANGRTEHKEVTNLLGKKVMREVPVREAIPIPRLINSGMVPPTFNASALPYQAWQTVDRAVIRASRDRLIAWADLAAANTRKPKAIANVLELMISILASGSICFACVADEIVPERSSESKIAIMSLPCWCRERNKTSKSATEGWEVLGITLAVSKRW